MSLSPEINLTGDHHIHTRLCNHARGEMEEYVQAAIEQGLQEMTFLEHLECKIHSDHRTWLTPELFAEYFLVGKRLQQKFKGRIAIRLGVEVGYNPSALPQIRTLLAGFPFEHVGLSYHFLAHHDHHLNMVSRRQKNLDALAKIGADLVVEKYFTGLIRACQEIPCDKLCHLDAVLRHLPGLRFTVRHQELIQRLLLTMQRHSIALEVNTSGIALRSFPYPALAIFNQARAMHLSIIPGSDAHRPDQVGQGFDQLQRLYC